MNVSIETSMSINAERIVEAVVLSVISFLAFSGNVSLWLIVCTERYLRTPSNMLILSLSAADIMVSVVNMPIIVYTIIVGDWPFSKAACKALGFITMLTFVASVMNLGNISINRYFHICHPARFKTLYNTRNAMFFIIGTWALSVCLALPPLLGWCRYDYIDNQSFCFAYWKDSIGYTYFMVGMCFGGPCSVMTFCYVNILRTHRHSAHRVGVHPNDVPRQRRSSSLTRKGKKQTPQTMVSEWRQQRALRRRQEELRLTMSLFIVICIFIICWLPFCITIFMWVHGNRAPRILDMITLLFGCFNSACNPIIYGVMNRKFREGYIKLFLCHRLRGNTMDSNSGEEPLDKTHLPPSPTNPTCVMQGAPTEEVAV